MLTKLVKSIILTSYGNACVQAGHLFESKDGNNVFFKDSDNLYIKKNNGDTILEKVCTDLNLWFDYLLNNKAKKLLLGYGRHLSCSESEKSTNSDVGSWLIEAQFEYGHEAWSVKIEEESVVLFNLTNYSFTTSTKGILEAEKNLLTALLKANSFIEKTKFYGWGEHFSEVIDFIHNKEKQVSSDQLLPDICYGPAARRLFFFARKSWVFGGMGSWNDLFFEDKIMNDEYEEVTHLLYKSVSDALYTAVNSVSGSEWKN